MRRILMFLAALLVCNTAFAVDTLLLEITWRQPNPVTLPANYWFQAADERNGGQWVELVSSFDHHSWADDETVQDFNGPFAYTHTTAAPYAPGISMRNGSQSPEPFGCATCPFPRLVLKTDPVTGEDWTQRVAEVGWETMLHVPYLGPAGLNGYALTDIERIVTPEGQTIRLYGTFVPEPGCFLLIAHLSMLFLALARPRARR